MKMTEQQRAAMIRRSAYGWSCFQPDTPAEEILSRIYCDGLADKSPRQGRLMAGELLDWMGRFQQGYDAMLEDPEGYAGWLLDQETAPLLAENRLAVLRRLMGVEDPDGPAQEAGEEALRQQAVKLLVNREAAAEVEQRLLRGEAQPRNRRLVKTVCGEEMTLAASSMVVYTMVKSGELTLEEPAAGPGEDPLTLGQVTVGVCAEDLLQGICQEEQAGYLSPGEAARRRYAASAACRVMLVLAGLAGGALLAAGGAVVSAGLAMLAGLGPVLAEKYRLDREMVEECAGSLTAPPVELSAGSWQPARQTPLPAASPAPEAQETPQEESQETPLTLF